jgi:hypothetical protein
MRIDGHHRAEPVALCDRCQADRRFALVATDLEDRALRRRAGGDQREESAFTLRQEPGRGLYSRPGFLDGFRQISWLMADG